MPPGFSSLNGMAYRYICLSETANLTVRLLLALVKMIKLNGCLELLDIFFLLKSRFKKTEGKEKIP